MSDPFLITYAIFYLLLQLVCLKFASRWLYGRDSLLALFVLVLLLVGWIVLVTWFTLLAKLITPAYLYVLPLVGFSVGIDLTARVLDTTYWSAIGILIIGIGSCLLINRFIMYCLSITLVDFTPLINYFMGT